MICRPSDGIPNWIDSYPYIKVSILEISELRDQQPLHIMINRLKPGVEVPIHRDYILPTQTQRYQPCVERWHLPISSNDRCGWWDEDSGNQYPKLGEWFGPVPYWIPHKVWNFGTTDRIHLVIDLDTPKPVGKYK